MLKAKIASYKSWPSTRGSVLATAQTRRADRRLRVGTRVIFVSIGSFDTHAGQRAQQDRLLGYMSNGLLAFYKDLTAHGLANNVLAMTFSEFGRRVAQNARNGTDHGTAMPLFVAGGKVKGGVYGSTRR